MRIGTCRHCGCGIDMDRTCKICGKPMADQCTACHEEVAHDVTRNMNLHFVSSGKRKFNTPDEDVDAFKRADHDDV